MGTGHNVPRTGLADLSSYPCVLPSGTSMLGSGEPVTRTVHIDLTRYQHVSPPGICVTRSGKSKLGSGKSKPDSVLRWVKNHRYRKPFGE